MEPTDQLVLIQETVYDGHPKVNCVQLWARRNEVATDRAKKYTHYYQVHFRDGPSKNIENKSFDPVAQNSPIILSCDDAYLFSPHYEKGITQIDLETGEPECLYAVKHMCSVWATSASLLCIHGEYRPQLVRYEIGAAQPAEKIRVAGIAIVPLQRNCILCKTKETQYALIDPDHLDRRSTVSMMDLCGFEDAAFEIERAEYANGKIYAKYCRSDPNHRGMLLHCEEFLNSSPSAAALLKKILEDSDTV